MNKFMVDDMNLMPIKQMECRVKFYVFEPGDCTKYEVGICEDFGSFWFPRNIANDYILVVHQNSYYTIHKDDIRNIHEGSIAYFSNKLHVDLHTAKVLMTFIQSLLAIEAKQELGKNCGS